MTASIVLAAAFSLTQVASYDYDELGRVIAERSGSEGRLVARYAYDPEGRVTEVGNGNGETTWLSYDALGRVVTSTDAKGGVTRFAYNNADRITQVTDPRGLATTYSHNGFGDLLALSSPDTGTTTYAYRATRADGTSLGYSYDGLGRATQVSGGTASRSFHYDYCGVGFLCETRASESGAVLASTQFTYTADGRLVTRTDAVQGAQDLTQYQYDGLGRLVGVAYPSGVGVGYGYSQGRLTAITATVNGTTQTVLSNVRYRPFGGPETWTYRNGLERRYNVDDKGLLTGVSAVHGSSGTLAQSLTYGFDGANRINAIANGAGAPTRQDFGYDANGRLAWDQISGQDGHSLVDAYDANGNRQRHGWEGAVEQHAIDPSSNRLLWVSGTSLAGRHHTYAYDARGNRIGDTTAGITTSLVFDAFN